MADYLENECVSIAIDAAHEIRRTFYMRLGQLLGDDFAPEIESISHDHTCDEDKVKEAEKEMKTIRETYDKNLKKIRDKVREHGKEKDLENLLSIYEKALLEEGKNNAVSNILDTYYTKLNQLLGEDFSLRIKTITLDLIIAIDKLKKAQENAQKIRELYNKNWKKIKDKAKEHDKEGHLEKFLSTYKEALSEAVNEAWRQEIENLLDKWNQ